MKTLYLDCGMGAAGDMLAAALLELLPDRAAFLAELNRLGIPGVTYEATPAVKCGVVGTRLTVRIDGKAEGEEPHHHDHDAHHHHSGMADVEAIVNRLALPERVKADALAVYGTIADAESHVHGVPVTDIHFHEVGTMDAVADVTAVCLLMHRLSPDEVVASPVHVGAGHVHCAHGVLPVPAPATARLLRGVPIYGGKIEGELCTPTGAALLRHFVTRFGDMPVMAASAVGYGMGERDFEAANCVRALLGESAAQTDEVLELSCNVDDMTGEAVGYAMERIFEAGAREVFTIPVTMKKSRPGILLVALCGQDAAERVTQAIFRHTGTIGVRSAAHRRTVLERHEETLETPYGAVRCKTSVGCGVKRRKLEYDDLARIARARDISLEEARALVEKEWKEQS